MAPIIRASEDKAMTGMLVDGRWQSQAVWHNEEGRFERRPTTIRHRIVRGGKHPPEANRYHLYVSWACPWAHRTLVGRALRKLDSAISISVVHWRMGDEGWTFEPGPGVIGDSVNGARLLRDVYLAADPKFTGRVTVPVLWDKKTATIVNNESREILRMLDVELGELGDRSVDLAPADLREAIDRTIDAIYEPVNNGVYRAGFAGNQGAYDAAVSELFAALDFWDGLLAGQRFLVGDRLTEADICLFTTLLRFDLVYHTHFKCNVRRIVDYPNLWGFLRDVYQQPGVAATCNFEHMKRHYYESHPNINPTRIVARGPALDLKSAHDRDRFDRERSGAV
jgi:putative glutathione S-transferase